MAALIGAITAGALAWLLVVLAAAAGAPMPVAGPLVRVRGIAIYQGTDKLRAAFGLESATIEVVEIVGPIIVTALITGVGRLAGLVAIVICALGGTLALAAQRGTEPASAGPLARGCKPGYTAQRSSTLPGCESICTWSRVNFTTLVASAVTHVP
jgi:hypothetical protein